MANVLGKARTKTASNNSIVQKFIILSICCDEKLVFVELVDAQYSSFLIAKF